MLINPILDELKQKITTQGVTFKGAYSLAETNDLFNAKAPIILVIPMQETSEGNKTSTYHHTHSIKYQFAVYVGVSTKKDSTGYSAEKSIIALGNEVINIITGLKLEEYDHTFNFRKRQMYGITEDLVLYHELHFETSYVLRSQY